MPVRVRLPEMLRRYAGGADTVAVEGTTVGAALTDLFRRHEPLRVRVVGADGRVFPYVAVLVGGREVPREDVLGASLGRDDEIELIGAAEGG